MDPAGLAVIHDYKLSKRAVAGAKLVEEGRLQVPLYWEAVSGAADMQPVAAVYRPLEGGRPRGMLDADLAPHLPGEYRTDRMASETLNELLLAARAETEQAVAGIRAGAVPTAPRGGSCPAWCDLASICRVETR